MQFSTSLSLFPLLASLVQVATPAATPNPPGFTYLYSLNCTLGASFSIGSTRGARVAIPITGGTVTGPRISGKVLDLGADWGVTDNNGTFNADTRYNVRTDDGANIFLQTSGPTQADGHIHLRMIFETGSTKYGWLNNIVAVGILTAGNGYVHIDGWQLTSPA
ncbi:hypothetical protein F5Y19DRAFT_484013 [Xylariaceae sp. FL1651]|nr:hypothetical protein F5Y19DRAFT_484013 [Xylariaceae sp. FL1651]